MSKVAINGLGRIGRALVKIVQDTPQLELAAVNDLIPADNLAYLMRYDSVYGRHEHPVESRESGLRLGDRLIPVFSEKDPAKLPWKDLEIDAVFECTGVFRHRQGLQKHLDAGAGRVVLSAPAKSEDVEMIVHGVNEPRAEAKMISCASCTTNCITPVAEVMGRRIGIRKAAMTTVVDGDLVKLLSWYDNEWGYSAQMVKEAVRLLR